MKKNATVSLQLYQIFVFVLYAICFVFLIWFAIQLYSFFNQNDESDIVAVELIASELQQAVYVQERWNALPGAPAYESVFPLSFSDNRQIIVANILTDEDSNPSIMDWKKTQRLCLWTRTGDVSLTSFKRIKCLDVDKKIRNIYFKIPKETDTSVLYHPIPVLLNYKLTLEKKGDQYDATIELHNPTFKDATPVSADVLSSFYGGGVK